MIGGVDWITFKVNGDERGSLIAIENNKDIPFSIGRIYYIFGSSYNCVRGKHAHKDLNQVLICINGSCDILIDNGFERQTVHLDTKDKGIYIHGFVWREMSHFSDDCVLLAIVDKPYDPKDYVFDYQTMYQLVEREIKQ